MYAGRIVERGPVDEVLLQPRHPYTEGLLASIPSRARRGERLNVIKGSVPNPFNMPPGCNFAPRCPYALRALQRRTTRCSATGRSRPGVACWLWMDRARRRACRRRRRRPRGCAVAPAAIGDRSRRCVTRQRRGAAS